MNETFGKILKLIRREKGVSQRELAEKVGVDFSYISKVENDRLPPPAADTIVKIASVLDIPSEDLLSQTNKLPTDIKHMLSSSTAALQFMNMAKEMDLSNDEWGALAENLKRLR